MPTIEENLNAWSQYNWPDGGDEWSQAWGGTDYLWYGTIFPRLQYFLPTSYILEIAPGFGRMTNYLRKYCEKLIVVDLTEKCINACKERFATDTHIHYHVNDGKSLSMIPDKSIDFIFSWDSLVHAEADAIEGYINEFPSMTLRNISFYFRESLYIKALKAKNVVTKQYNCASPKPQKVPSAPCPYQLTS